MIAATKRKSDIFFKISHFGTHSPKQRPVLKNPENPDSNPGYGVKCFFTAYSCRTFGIKNLFKL